MATARRVLSVLLSAAAGAIPGAFIGGILTCFVYFVGAFPGALTGMLIVGRMGLQLHLRDSVTLFVTTYGGLILGSAITKIILAGRSDANPGAFFMLDLALPFIVAFAVVATVFLPVYHYTSFETRRRVAIFMATLAVLWPCWRLYHFAYIWQP